MATIVTTFSFEGFHSYGSRFLESMAAYWPITDPLIMFCERPVQGARGLCMPLAEVAGLESFKTRNAGDLPRGRVPNPSWKPKDQEKGYSFKTDAVKFSNKVFVVREAARMLKSGIFAWFDADVVITDRPPDNFVEGSLHGQDVAYLGRTGVHPECGYLPFRLPEALPLIERWAWYYESGRVFMLREWHDSFVFAQAVNDVEARWYDLSPGGHGHVWQRSPLAAFSDHLKGDRKGMLRSPERARP